jgi:O-antigen ligase
VIASSVPAGRATTRRTGSTPALPPWAFGGLLIAALGLGAAAVFDDQAVYIGAALLFLIFGGALVFYRPHIGVLVIMSTMLMSYPAALRGFGPFTINNLLGVTLVTILVFEAYRTHDYWFLREPEIRLLLIIAVWLIAIQALSDLYLPDKRLLPAVARKKLEGGFYGQADDSARWTFELVSRIAFVIFFVKWIKTPRQLLWALFLFAVCIAAVVPTLGPDVTRGEGEFRITSKVVGWAVNLNRFAFMMNVGIALFIYLANVVRPVLLKAAFLTCAVTSLPLVLLSASRSGFLGLALVGLMLLRGGQIPRRWKIGSAMVGLALSVLAFNFVLTDAHRERLLNLNPFATTQDQTAVVSEGSRSTETRVTTLGEAMAIIKSYPLTGVGLANFRWVNALMHGSYKPPHNSYVWAAAEGGIPAVILYLTLFGFLFTRIQKLRPKYANHPTLPYFPDWLNLYLILLFFFSIFADVWLEVHLYFLIAFAIVLSRWAEDAELRGRGLPGLVAGTPGARRAAARALYQRG